MVQPFFNIVGIKAEYYEVYAEFRLLSCEHKIFIVSSTAIGFSSPSAPDCDNMAFTLDRKQQRQKGSWKTIEKLWFLCWFYQVSDTTCDSI